jgi:hypothetical protein
LHSPWAEDRITPSLCKAITSVFQVIALCTVELVLELDDLRLDPILAIQSRGEKLAIAVYDPCCKGWPRGEAQSLVVRIICFGSFSLRSGVFSCILQVCAPGQKIIFLFGCGFNLLSIIR